MKVALSSSALEDLANVSSLYTKQERWLGAYFEESLCTDIESLKNDAGKHPKVLDYFRLLSKRVPFAIYYEVIDEVVRVRAILDYRKGPGPLIKPGQEITQPW